MSRQLARGKWARWRDRGSSRVGSGDLGCSRQRRSEAVLGLLCVITYKWEVFWSRWDFLCPQVIHRFSTDVRTGISLCLSVLTMLSTFSRLPYYENNLCI